MFRAYKVFLATAYPPPDLVKTMKRFLACMALCASLSASTQVVYPYNPDANGDSAITSGDLLDFLPVFATTFTPEGITIDGVPLDEWLSDLEAVVNSNTASIESLFAMQSQINELETANDNLQSQINSLQNQLNNLTFSVDGLPPCIDIDNDGICDFADACPPTFLYFCAQNDFGDDVYPEMLYAGGVWYNAQLDGADLSYACLPEIILSYSSLTGANLTGANFAGASLNMSVLISADLSGADLSGADLVYTVFNDADLTSADLQGADLSHSTLTGANLTGANLALANLTAVNFTGANLTDADLRGADLQYASLTYVDLSSANIFFADMICLFSCPSSLPSGFICEPDPDCPTATASYQTNPPPA